MKKYIVTLLLVSVFIVSFSFVFEKVSAYSMSFIDFSNFLIKIGVIPVKNISDPEISINNLNKYNLPTTGSTGTYSCLGCVASHKWFIDNDHMMWWDNKPYIPYTGFGVKNYVNNPFNITDFNIWIDSDANNPNKDPLLLDAYTSEITNSGGTYIVQLSTSQPSGNDASKLFDSSVRKQIVDSWKKYKNAISKDGLRAIVIWNEIDVGLKWPKTHTSTEYGLILADLAKEVKTVFGDIPVSFKITESYIYAESQTGVNAIISGAANPNVGGLGYDSFPVTCNTSDFTPLKTLKSRLESVSGSSSWLWVAEWGKGMKESDPARDPNCYWGSYPPFQSKDDMRCYLNNFVDNGARGFVYNGPRSIQNDSDCSGSYYQSYVWYGELKNEILSRISSSTNVVIPTCTSFTYSNWGVCSNNLQSRTVLTSLPNNCSGGTPVVSQSCVTPPQKYFNVFSGKVTGDKTFDLGKLVNVKSLSVEWADDYKSCLGLMNVSSDGIKWNTKKEWSHVLSPSSFSLSNLGNIRYIRFSKTTVDCLSYNISSMRISGTY